jgi:4-diphosphocytidyl-2-C-methyl-D-erythritol kinase
MSHSSLLVRTPAKLNLVLEVLGARPDGFHELALVFQAIGLFDELSFFREKEGVELFVSESPEPLEAGESNLVVRAARLFLKEALKGREGVRITLKKKIPLAAGLGGGSSDAAATLWALDRLFETALDFPRLSSLAASLGSDVAFFLKGGTALGTGRGENLTALTPAPELALVLAKPEKGLSTKAVYQSGKARLTDGARARAFEAVLKEGHARRIAGELFNGLEPATFFLMPETREFKNRLLEAGALGALVSGSGPTVFGLAENKAWAVEIAEKLKDKGLWVMTTTTVPDGVKQV